MCHLWYKQEEVTVGADQCNHSPLLLALSCRGLHRFENIYPTQKGTNICQDSTIGHFSLSDGHCVRLGNQRFRNSCHNRPDYTLDLFHMTDPRSLLHFSIFALMHKRVIGSPGQWRHRANIVPLISYDVWVERELIMKHKPLIVRYDPRPAEYSVLSVQ